MHHFKLLSMHKPNTWSNFLHMENTAIKEHVRPEAHRLLLTVDDVNCRGGGQGGERVAGIVASVRRGSPHHGQPGSNHPPASLRVDADPASWP